MYPERQNLKHHVSKDCPLTVVNCNFHYAGCEVQLIRQDMPAHLAENLVPHMAQLATYNQKKVQEKDQQIMQLTEDLRQALEKNRQKIDQLERENEALSMSLLEKIAQLQEDLRVKDKATAEMIAKIRADAVAKGDDIVALQQKQQESEKYLKTKEEEAPEKDKELQHEIAALKRRQEDAVSKEESEAIKQDIAALRQTIIQLREKQKEMVSKVDYETTKQELTQLKAKQEKDRSSLQTLQLYTATPPVELTMTDFAKHKQDGDKWYSEPFYTHLSRYKMCLKVDANACVKKVDANACGKKVGTHISIYCHLMQGKFDDHLRWPFSGNITVQLLNQVEDKMHSTHTISYSSAGSSRVTTGERATDGYGDPKFLLPHSELGHDAAKNRQFLKDDCLRFRITEVTNLMWTKMWSLFS